MDEFVFVFVYIVNGIRRSPVSFFVTEVLLWEDVRMKPSMERRGPQETPGGSGRRCGGLVPEPVERG